jgi:hypothetical protein
MEIRYCDRCNGIISVKGGAGEPPPNQHLCAECEAGKGAEAEGPKKAPEVDDIPADALNLFSPATIAVRKDQLKKAVAAHARSGGTAAAPPAGQGAPGMIQIECLHCQVHLKVRPVEKTSRLVCPKCKGNLFLGPNGSLSKAAPGAPAVPAVSAASPTKDFLLEGPAAKKKSGILGAGLRKDAHPARSQREQAPPQKEPVSG